MTYDNYFYRLKVYLSKLYKGMDNVADTKILGPWLFFGSAKVLIERHEIYKQGFLSHRATIRIMDGSIDPIHMENELIDLVSKQMGFDPLVYGVYGSRVAIKKDQNNLFGLFWSTGTGVIK